MESKSASVKRDEPKAKSQSVHVLRAKKVIALLLVIIGGLYAMQIFQLGPWTLNPDLKWPYLSFIDDPRYNLGISCETPAECELTLKYGVDKSNLNISLTDKEDTKLHFFELRNLKADTKYYWKLISSDNSIKYAFLDQVYGFKTAPDPSEDKSFAFTVVGDTRPDIFGNSRFPKLMKLMINEEPNFMINVGDIVMGPGFMWPRNQWDRFFYDIRGCADIGAAYMIGLGNHEWDEYSSIFGEDKGQTYKYYFNYPHEENYYAFNYSNAAFISIDTNSGEITEQQKLDVKRWLVAANRSSDIDWIIVYGHYPIYYANGINNYVGGAFEQMFIDYNVDMFLAGHHHHYARSEVDGITYIISGGGGAELDIWLDNPDHIEKSALTFQYCTIEIDGDELKFECISHNGMLIDEIKLEPRKE